MSTFGRPIGSTDESAYPKELTYTKVESDGLIDSRVLKTSEVLNASTEPTWDAPLVLTSITSPTIESVSIVGANPTATLWPNGDITGSSDNGSFTKFANGKLECRKVDSEVRTTSNTVDSLFGAPNKIFTFPIVFASVPSISVGSIPVGWTVWASYGSVLVSSFGHIMISTRVSATGTSSYTAHGRWK